MNDRDDPVVLIVEDERALADLFTSWLQEDYTVRTAYTGEEALDLVDHTVDVLLLDRRLPDISGDEVLGQVRKRGIDCRVSMITGTNPDFDLLKLDIDEYLTKPNEKGTLEDVVADLINRNTLNRHLQQYQALAAKKRVLGVCPKKRLLCR